MTSTADVVPDDEVVRVHGHANFGSTTPRRVVDELVLKAAVGYHSGSTATAIGLEHGLLPDYGPYRYAVEYLDGTSTIVIRAIPTPRPIDSG